MNPYRTATACMLVIDVAFLILWDVWVAGRGGKEATISHVITDSASKWLALAVAAGVLIGHLFFSEDRRGDDEDPKR